MPASLRVNLMLFSLGTAFLPRRPTPFSAPPLLICPAAFRVYQHSRATARAVRRRLRPDVTLQIALHCGRRGPAPNAKRSSSREDQ